MKKILVVVTNHSRYEKRERKTGLWLGELVHFIEPIVLAEIVFEIVSPLGGEIPLDPESLKSYAMDKSIRAFYANPSMISILKNTKCVSDVNPNDFEAVYYTGGHGTMWDYPTNGTLQEISKIIYEKGGVVSAVCHGVSGLLNIKLSNGTLLIKDKNLTGYSNFEEVLAGVSRLVPFSLQNELQKKGAHYKKALFPFVSFVQRDVNLITGQNPFSTKAVAAKVINQLKGGGK
jgi:putative intracellular protease/amidase